MRLAPKGKFSSKNANSALYTWVEVGLAGPLCSLTFDANAVASGGRLLLCMGSQRSTNKLCHGVTKMKISKQNHADAPVTLKYAPESQSHSNNFQLNEFNHLSHQT